MIFLFPLSGKKDLIAPKFQCIYNIHTYINHIFKIFDYIFFYIIYRQIIKNMKNYTLFILFLKRIILDIIFNLTRICSQFLNALPISSVHVQ